MRYFFFFVYSGPFLVNGPLTKNGFYIFELLRKTIKTKIVKNIKYQKFSIQILV